MTAANERVRLHFYDTLEPRAYFQQVSVSGEPLNSLMSNTGATAYTLFIGQVDKLYNPSYINVGDKTKKIV